MTPIVLVQPPGSWRTSAAIRLDLPTPGGPVIADDVRGAGLRVDLADELVGQRVAVLDERDRPGERTPVALAHARRERLARPLAALAPCSDAGLSLPARSITWTSGIPRASP